MAEHQCAFVQQGYRKYTERIKSGHFMGKWGHYKYYCHLRSFIKQDKNKLIRKSLAAFTKKKHVESIEIQIILKKMFKLLSLHIIYV